MVNNNFDVVKFREDNNRIGMAFHILKETYEEVKESSMGWLKIKKEDIVKSVFIQYLGLEGIDFWRYHWILETPMIENINQYISRHSDGKIHYYIPKKRWNIIIPEYSVETVETAKIKARQEKMNIVEKCVEELVKAYRQEHGLTNSKQYAIIDTRQKLKG